MNTKAVGIVAAFTALATALNLVKIPVPYNPYFSYQLGDIIFVIAFLLFGLKIGFTVAVLNMLISIVITPSLVGLIGGPYYLVAVASMVLGVYFNEKIIKPRIQNRRMIVAKSVSISTILSVIFRTLIMLPLDYFVLGFLVSIVSGGSLAESYAIVLFFLPGIVIYNITVPLFAIPTSYYTAEKVSKHYKSSLFTKSLINNNSGKQTANVGSPFKPVPTLEVKQANSQAAKEKT